MNSDNLIRKDISKMGEIGNTNSISPVLFTVNGKSLSGGNSKSQLKHWFFTLHNYEEIPKWKELLIKKFDSICLNYCFQEEVGLETKRKHIQGIISLKKRMRWTEFHFIDIWKFHWEKCNNLDAAIDYCSKDESYEGGFRINNFKKSIVKKELKIINKDLFRPFQHDIIKICDSDPDDRTVYVIRDTGNNGKTVLSKYIHVNYKTVIVTSGKYRDVSLIVNNFNLNKDNDINDKFIVLFNLPKNGLEKVDWKCIEGIKDGILTSTKYESNTLVFNPPHVIILCNEHLNDYCSVLTKDKWKVFDIIDHKLVPYDHTKVHSFIL